MRPQAAVLGSPIAHSLSPALHGAAYAVLGLDWQYQAIECTAGEFPDFLAGLGPQWQGLSLTMPVKEVALEVIEQVSDSARAVSAVNTIYRGGDGRTWQAANTDIDGIERALRHAGVSSVGVAHILGAGATARSCVAALARLGAERLVVHARRAQAAESVAELAHRLGIRASTADLSPADLDCDVLMNTLPADVAAPWSEVGARSDTALLDASYHPWPTALAESWTRLRPQAALASGRDMLLWQAVAQVGLMTGAYPLEALDFPDDATGRVAQRVYAAMRAVIEDKSA